MWKYRDCVGLARFQKEYVLGEYANFFTLMCRRKRSVCWESIGIVLGVFGIMLRCAETNCVNTDMDYINTDIDKIYFLVFPRSQTNACLEHISDIPTLEGAYLCGSIGIVLVWRAFKRNMCWESKQTSSH